MNVTKLRYRYLQPVHLSVGQQLGSRDTLDKATGHSGLPVEYLAGTTPETLSTYNSVKARPRVGERFVPE